MSLHPFELKALAIELAAAIPPAPPSDMQDRPIDVSERARAIRAIQRIAHAHHWEDAITHFLETRGAQYMSDLSMPQLSDLLDRMHGYVDAAETGCSPANCLPAT